MMHPLRNLLARFRHNEESQQPPQGEVAQAFQSGIYAAGDFPRYNPDDLIGRKGHSIYRKMLLDEQVKAVVYFKRGAITSRPYNFRLDPEESGLSEEEVKRRTRLFQEVLDQMEGSFRDALNGIASAIYQGYSTTEKVYKLIEWDGLTWWGVKKLPLRPFDTFRFDTDAFGNVDRIVQNINGNEVDIDAHRLIHHVHNPDIDEHYGQSELRSVYRCWFSKDLIIKFRNIYLERHAGGFRWVQPTGDRKLQHGSKEYNDLVDMMTGASGSTAMILPSGLEFKMQIPANQVAYEEALTREDKGIAKGLLVPNLLGITEQGETGSYSQASVQFEAFLWTLDADAKRLEDTLNEQLFRPLGDYNFGDGVYPRFEFQSMSEEQKRALAEAWGNLVQKGAVQRTESDEARLRELMDMPEAAELPETDEPEGEAPEPEEPEGEAPEDDIPEPETVVGRSRALIDLTKFERAVKRVDFAVIDKQADEVAETQKSAAAKVMDEIVRDVVVRADQGEFLSADDVQKMALDGRKKRKLRNELRKALERGFQTGGRHAESEVSKAKGESFSFDRKRIDMVGEDFFEAKSFQMAGNLSGAALAVIKNQLFLSLKNGWSQADTRKAIYKQLASEGYISQEAAEEELGEALGGINNASARIDTIIRTNTFEALNEGRWASFTDPGLEGFVEAMEYSAILDRRTTQICQHLDGRTYGKDSEVWTNQGYRPPNHHNALPAGTMIRTRRGDKPIEEIGVGNHVLTHNGRWKPVTETMFHETWPEEIVLRFDGGHELTLTEDHPVLTERGWVCAGDLETTDTVMAYGGPCEECGKWTRNERFCSDSCKWKAAGRIFHENASHRHCENCGEEILLKGKKKNARFCSQSCMGESMRTITGKACENCGEPMIGKWRAPVSPERRFCCQACYFSFKGETSIERVVREWLAEWHIQAKPQHPVGPYVVDFYLPDYGVAVEVDGEYWHGPAGKPEDRVETREQYLVKHGISVIHIPESAIKSGRYRKFISEALHDLEGKAAPRRNPEHRASAM